MYENGTGAPQDDTEALKWFRQAPEQGDADAQWRLGWMYYKGEHVPQDYAEALKWCQKAAEQGHYGAHRALDRLFRPLNRSRK